MSLEIGSAWLASLIKLSGLKAACGMIGAALLFVACPPENPTTNRFNRREFVVRLAVAGVFSIAFGDWVVDVVNGYLPSLLAPRHPGVFWLATGAPGWWISRWVALWLYAKRDKDAAQVIQEIKTEVHP